MAIDLTGVGVGIVAGYLLARALPRLRWRLRFWRAWLRRRRARREVAAYVRQHRDAVLRDHDAFMAMRAAERARRAR